MLDKKDWNYIIKKVIIYLLIAFIMFICGCFNIKAETIDTTLVGSNINSNGNSTYGVYNNGYMYGYFSDLFTLTNNYTIAIGNTTTVTNATVNVSLYLEWKYDDGEFPSVRQGDGAACYLNGVYKPGWNNYICYDVTGTLIFVVNCGSPDSGVGYDSLVGIGRYITYESSEVDAINENTEAINEVNNTLTSEDLPTESMDFVGYLPTGPLDAIINMPLEFLNTLLDKLGTSCSSLILTLPFVDKEIFLPCIWEYLGTYIDGLDSILAYVSIVADIVILYHYLIYTYKWCDDLLTLRENNQFGGYE